GRATLPDDVRLLGVALVSGDGLHHGGPPAFSRARALSGLDENPCVPAPSFSTSNRSAKASQRACGEMARRLRAPVKGATMQGNSLGNQLRREDILPSFSMFYSLRECH